jgi:GNAT superfamily N-acetyltransferase
MNWYKQSSVRLLHGTSSEFEQFDLSFAGERDWGDFGLGVYLTRSDGVARSYADDAVKAKGGVPVIYEVEADVYNVANMDDPEIWSIISEKTGIIQEKVLIPGEKQSRPEQDSKVISEVLVSMGYDAAKGRNGYEWVVFDPSKIRIVGKHYTGEHLPTLSTAMNWYKLAQNENIELSNESTDAYQGQVNMQILAKDTETGQYVGGLEYVIFEDELTVSDVQVLSEYQRRGIATMMYDRMEADNPEKTYKPSLATPEGHAFVTDRTNKLTEKIFMP